MCVCVCAFTHTHTHTHAQSSAEPTDIFLAHDTLLYNEKGIKRIGQILGTEQAVYYFCILLRNIILEVASFIRETLSLTIDKTVE